MTTETDEVFGNYRLKEMLGKGGMAEVFLAQAVDAPPDAPLVAVKRLLPEMASNPKTVDLFVSEADLSRQLLHPAIVRTLETGVLGDTYYMVMEYVDGVTLAELMVECRVHELVFPIDLAMHITDTVASALDYAHALKSPSGRHLNIVHCDVTPSNVFLAFMGGVKLADFGVAHAGALGGLEPGTVAGKAHYLSAEQILGESVTPSTDLFALGVILYELLTGRHAFGGTSEEELWQAVVDGTAVAPSRFRDGIAPKLDTLLLRALSPVRAEQDEAVLSRMLRRFSGRRLVRYESAAALLADLRLAYDPTVKGRTQALASLLRGLYADFGTDSE